MDLLNAYNASSSESSGDDEDDDDDKKQVDHHEDTANGATNYFGFAQEDSESDYDENDQSKKSNEKKLNINGLELDVPKSAFWKSLSSDDLKEAQVKEVTLKRRAVENRENLKCFNKTRKYKKLGNNAGFTVDKAPQKDSITEGQLNLKRNVFYIHPKIKPAVHSQHQNYPAKSEERHIAAHVGVSNRVKWNTPQFSHLFLSAGMDSTVRIWNAWSTETTCLRELRHHGKAVKDAEWSADGRTIFSCSYDRTAILSDVETGKIICKLDHKTYVTCGKFHPFRRSQVVTGSTNCIQHWDVRTPDTALQQYQCKDDMGQVQDVLFCRDGNEFFSSSDVITRESADRSIIAWDFTTGVSLSNQIYQERYSCTRLKNHTTSGHFLAQSSGGYIALFSVHRPYKMVRSKRFEGHKMLGYSIGFDVSRDGRLVYSGSSDGNLHCYDFYSGRARHKFNTGLGVCMDVACHPVLPGTVVTCSWGGQVKVFH